MRRSCRPYHGRVSSLAGLLHQQRDIHSNHSVSKWTDLQQALADETHEIFVTYSSKWNLVTSPRSYLVPPERLEMFVSSIGRASDTGDRTHSFSSISTTCCL
ncbi:hypothetical protein BLNAU_1542 [Blattamonas nauphoetae]|uniref:Uncharacterized protein n=1 Tax=Blattamonas nauphoetae TaxID=2049346 RepID=A0ABQ9YIS7_9EUKA|nr:hypothetical protein BLNAU_13602 [Blattamonas nauphoetae]KAK2963499.1 hypothetical protein BLNAU_1542 [Blattamonas nauphoetae]